MTTLEQARAVSQRLRETYTAYNESSDEFIHRLQLERLDAANAIVALIAEIERLRVDAARYQWLKERAYKDGDTLSCEVAVIDDIAIGNFSEFIDAAIDAARAALEGTK